MLCYYSGIQVGLIYKGLYRAYIVGVLQWYIVMLYRAYIVGVLQWYIVYYSELTICCVIHPLYPLDYASYLILSSLWVLRLVDDVLLDPYNYFLLPYLVSSLFLQYTLLFVVFCLLVLFLRIQSFLLEWLNAFPILLLLFLPLV